MLNLMMFTVLFIGMISSWGLRAYVSRNGRKLDGTLKRKTTEQGNKYRRIKRMKIVDRFGKGFTVSLVIFFTVPVLKIFFICF